MGLLLLKLSTGGSVTTAFASGFEAQNLIASDREVSEALIAAHGLLILAAGSLAVYAALKHAYYSYEQAAQSEPTEYVVE